MHERDSGNPWNSLLIYSKTDIEQTNSTEFYANVFQTATCKFFIRRRTAIDDLDIRIAYFLLYSDPVYPFDAGSSLNNFNKSWREF